MATSSHPYATVSSSTVAYAVALYSLSKATGSAQPEQLRKSIKAISALHSSGTTVLALYALTRLPWPIKESSVTTSKSLANSPKFDDTRNPTISGTSVFANRLTAWETGYLIYDTGALLVCSYLMSDRKSIRDALRVQLKDSPVFLVHHLALVTALLYLQTYIANGREKGLWVIVAFLLMNASNPLLHLRWALKKEYGKVSKSFDAVFAAAFAASRFGVVALVLQKYGRYHDMSAWKAYSTLRVECRTGVTLLVGLNAVWWLGMVRKLAKESLKTS